MLRKNAHFELMLARLVPLLAQEDMVGLEEALLDISLEKACSREFIDFCRMRSEAPLVMMLTTLGEANGLDALRCGRILAVYQSALAQGKILGGLEILPANHVLLQALAVWWCGKNLPLEEVTGGLRLSGTDADFELAIEFLLDHDRSHAASDLILERWHGKGNDRHRLTLIECLLTRQGARQPAWGDLVHWNRCYEHAYNVLSKVHDPALSNLREQIGQVICENLLHSPHPQLALKWLQVGRSPRGKLKSCYHRAHAYCRLGQMPQAIASMDELLRRLPNESLEWIQDNFRAPGGNSDAGKHFDLDGARAALTDLTTVLAKINARPFLVSGTLLGYARCKNFLSHDKDIDVGILESDDGFQVLQTLGESGLFRIDTSYMRLERNYNLVCWHLPTGMPIDIFVYHREGDKLVTGVQTDLGYLQRFQFTPFALQPIEFVGAETYAPADIALNLEENFGDWQVPDPGYMSHLESPSTENPGGDVHMFVGRLMMFTAIIKNKPQLIRRVARVLRRHEDSLFAMSPELLQQLEQHYGGSSDASDTSAATAAQADSKEPSKLPDELANV